MKTAKYVEPAKALSVVLLTLLIVAWKIYADDSGQLHKLTEVRQLLAEWFFCAINLEQLEANEAFLDEPKKEGKQVDDIPFPLPLSPFGGSREIGTVHIEQSATHVRVFVDPRYQKEQPKSKLENIFLSPGDGERLDAPPSDAVTWSVDLSGSKIRWINDLFAAKRQPSVGDLIWSFASAAASKQGKDLNDGMSQRALRLSAERYSVALALDSLYQSANIGLSPWERYESATIAARTLKGDVKAASPDKDEEKVIVGHEFNRLDKHYRESHAKVPFIELDADPPVSLLILTCMAILCVVVIRSSATLVLRDLNAGLDEPWPVFDSPDITGRILGGVWIIIIAAAPALTAALGCGNAFARFRMSLTPVYWWWMFIVLAIFGTYHGILTGQMLWRLMCTRWVVVDGTKTKRPRGSSESPRAS